MGKLSKYSRWCLYWVASGGEEDTFVAARNSRSAAKLEAETCGFETHDLLVRKAASIAPNVAMRFFNRAPKSAHVAVGPRYADQLLLRRLGAQQRELEGRTETLIDDIVYTTNAEETILPRVIGAKYVEQTRADPTFLEFVENDAYVDCSAHLMRLFGICVARCQEIEHLIAHSFIFGVSDPQKHKYTTVNDMIAGWKRKTLGQQIKAIETSYEVDSVLQAALKKFLKMRNLLIHGLTTSDQFDVGTSWGRDEMLTFLIDFELLSRTIRKVIKGAYFAGIEYWNSMQAASEGKKILLSSREQREIDVFAHFFEVRISQGE